MSNGAKRGVAAASAVAGMALPLVHAGGNDTIKVALVGCGGGTGAAFNALAAGGGTVRLAAMADLFQDRLAASAKALQASRFADRIDVPEERRFLGFDGYRRAMDCLRPGGVVILTTPPAFRGVHFGYAVDKGLHAFLEKPVAVDGPTVRRMLRLAEASERKGLKVGVGLMSRHCDSRRELAARIRDGELGDLVLLRAYRLAGPTGNAPARPKPDNVGEVEFQVRRFHCFLWASGGAYGDFLIHNIDECCWMKDAWPVLARSSGGRHYKADADGVPFVDQNFDTYATEFTFADDAKLHVEGRTIPGCLQRFGSYAHGTLGAAVISENGHAPSHCRVFRGQDVTREADVVWRCPDIEPNPYDLEWVRLLAAVRNGRPYNEARRGAEADLTAVMGRMSAHTGRVITREEALDCDHEFAPEVDKLTLDGPAPLRARDGRYPVPQPGVVTRREYEA